MPHTPLHITKQELSREGSSGIRLAEEISRSNLGRIRTRGGLLGRALEVGAKGQRQTTRELETFAERGTRGISAAVTGRQERREFRREEFGKDLELSRQKRGVEFQLKEREINDFILAAKEAAKGQILSDVFSLGLSAILVGFAGPLGLSIPAALGIGATLGSAIGGVPASPLAQGIAQVGGGLVGGARAGRETKRLGILADRNDAITRFAGSQDLREGFVPVNGEQFRPR